MNAIQYPTNVHEQRYLISIPNEGWEHHQLPGKWETCISASGEVVSWNPNAKVIFNWFANFHTSVTIPEASVFPQRLQVERHFVDPKFSVFEDKEKKLKRNRKLSCGPVQPILGKFGGRWHILYEENWRHGVLVTINNDNEVTAMHFTAFMQREISRRSLDAFKPEIGFPEGSFEPFNVNQFLVNSARNFGIRSLHLLRYRDQTLATPIELPWPNAKWIPVTEVAFDMTPWIEIPVSENEVQIVPDGVLGATYDIWGPYALWMIVSHGYLPGLSIHEVLPPKA